MSLKERSKHPFCFLLYVNDLPFGLKGQTRLFADDYLIYIIIIHYLCCRLDKLQSDLKKLELWKNTWQMEFNPEECFIMCISKQRNPPLREYTFCNITLAYVEKHSYLGVTVDANLRWNHHLHELSPKAATTLNLIKRNFWFCDEDTKCLLYKTLVRPKRGMHQWSGTRTIYVMYIKQGAAAHFCKGDYKYSSSVTSMIKDLKWEPLASRGKQARLCIM